jgi:hypothetical protein
MEGFRSASGVMRRAECLGTNRALQANAIARAMRVSFATTLALVMSVLGALPHALAQAQPWAQPQAGILGPAPLGPGPLGGGQSLQPMPLPAPTSPTPNGARLHYVPQHFDAQGRYVPPHYEAQQRPKFRGYFHEDMTRRTQFDRGYKEPPAPDNTPPELPEKRPEGR